MKKRFLIILSLIVISLIFNLNERVKNSVVKISLGVNACDDDEINFYGKCFNVLKVFGQKNFKETSLDTIVANKASHAAGIVIDQSVTPNRIYVADTGNSRILGFESLGYCTANSNTKCTNDSDCPGSDTCNVFINKRADIVFGQPDMTSGACNNDNNLGVFTTPTKNTLCLIDYPARTNIEEYALRVDLAVDQQGNLYVPDIYNNRILKYNQPFSADKSNGKGDAVPDFVFGQDDFNSNGINNGLGANKRDNSSFFLSLHDSLSTRGGTSIDPDGNLWIADTYNGRMLRFSPGSKEADLVIGQRDFSSYENTACAKPMNQYINQYFDRLCQPGLARVHPETGDLYVMDITDAQDESGSSVWHSGRILVFSPPFSNGMSASEIIMPQQDGSLQSDVKEDWEYYFQPTGFTFNTFEGQGYENGILWVSEMTAARTILIDKDGNILKTIGVPNKYRLGCDNGYLWNQCGRDIEQNFDLCDPRGSVAFDNDNNIYVVDKRYQRIARFNLPYEIDERECVPLADAGLLDNIISNDVSGYGGVTSFGALVFENQLIIRDRYRFLVWNNYLNKPTGAMADFVVGQNSLNERERNSMGGFAIHTIDDKNRVWTNNEGKLTIYQLPFTSNTTPLVDHAKLYWSDDDAEIDYHGYGIVFDKLNEKIWLVDSKNNRILRISNYDDFENKLYVDMVIGQINKDGACCNQIRNPDGTCIVPSDANKHPRADTICYPTRLNMDNYGNLYVVENDSECHGNARITVFMAEDLRNESGVIFPNISAKKVFIRKSLTEPGSCSYLINEPHSPVSIAFNSKNQMVVGNDGYYINNTERHLKQLWFYDDPLKKYPDGSYVQGQTPDAYIELPLGAAGEMRFDDNGNFIIQDNNWSRVWLINLDQDPLWLKWLSLILGDLNDDDQVDIQDIKILLQNWGDSPELVEADLNYDNMVNGVDFSIILRLL